MGVRQKWNCLKSKNEQILGLKRGLFKYNGVKGAVNFFENIVEKCIRLNFRKVLISNEL